MPEPARHATHPAIVTRLTRAYGRLASGFRRIGQAQPCVEIAQQRHVVEKAVQRSERLLMQDQADPCPGAALVGKRGSVATTEFKAILAYP